ncbi:sulfotransferase family protein [Microbaculum sp. FT89]|uniref:sulfotransferase family protein n=1 Tax=Microbaculum sp. FT89 TaxID=3447298 RepID=UPI003F53C4CA
MRDVLWIAGMPRSGTSWFAQIMASHPDTRLKLCPLFSYSFKNALDERSTRRHWEDFFRAVYETDDAYMDQDFLRKDGLVPEFAEKADNPDVLVIKSNRFHHLLPHAIEQGVDARFVFIVRDPRATIASWLSNPMEFPSDRAPLEEWRSGACRKTAPGEFWGFEDWMHVTRLHRDLARRYPDRAHVVRYEDLLRDPLTVAEGELSRVGLEMHPRTRDFIAASRSRHSDNPRSVYKDPGQIGDWRAKLPAAIQETISAEIENSDLRTFLASDAD